MRNTMYGLIIMLAFLFAFVLGCDDDKDSGAEAALLLIGSQSKGCYFQGNCDSIPSTFIQQESMTADDCDDLDGVWRPKPSGDVNCHTGINTEITILDTTTTTYFLPK